MSELHTLLLRQLRKWFPEGAPDGAADFFEAVNEAYHQFDDDRRMLERALELSSQELIQANNDLRGIFESTADGILVIDAAGRITTWNQRFAQMWRLPLDALEARDRPRVLAAAAEQLVDPQHFLDRVRELYADPLAESFETLHFKDGRVFERYSIPHRLDGVPIGRVSSFRDVTARHRAEQRLLHDAIHDALTALPNRTLFMDRLGQAIRHSKRHLEHRFALLFVDVDRFKMVNDSLGHLVGDEMLVAIAGRIRDAIRPGDTVARLGGDEFTILLESIKDPEDAAVAAERIQHVISAPFTVRDHEIFTTVSIGIAVSAPHYHTAEEMLRDADIAMYRAKAQGRAGYQTFQPGMHTTAVALLQLENDLRRAVDRSEIVLHYQPIVSLEDWRILGFEALVRWNHPQRGLIYPAEFIAIAEETGLILPIGRWVLSEACSHTNQWQQMFGRDDLTVSVNISGRQLMQPGFVSDVERVLRETSLPPDTLCLEITETVLMENSQSAPEAIRHLRGLGVKIHIDDFGTGYSSLSYLHRFAIDTLKIDRSFISHVATGEESVEIIRTITALAGNLKVPVIAEGVETEVQRRKLQALGCQAAQGNFFSLPADATAVRTMIASGRFPGEARRELQAVGERG